MDRERKAKGIVSTGKKPIGESLTTCTENWLQNAVGLKEEYQWKVNLMHDDTVTLEIRGEKDSRVLDLLDFVRKRRALTGVTKRLRRAIR